MREWESMNLQKIVEYLSKEETLDIKELVLTLFNDANMETIYENIKDTSN
jgi:hypothetical protein